MAKVLLAVPTMGSVDGVVMPSLLALANSMGLAGHQAFVPQLRNMVPYDKPRIHAFKYAGQFECDLVLFVDSDSLCPPDTFHLLWRVMQETKAQMTVGHVHRRGYPYTPTWFKAAEGKMWHIDAPKQSGVVEVDSCGMACNLIDYKWVVEHVAEPYFYVGKFEGYDVLEDTWFCRQLKLAGGKIIGVPELRVGHMGDPVIVTDENATELRRRYLAECAEVADGK